MMSYLAPSLAAWTVVMVAGLAYPPNDDDPTLFPHVARAVWLVLWPAGLALGQWMLVRRYLRRAHFWALATFAGALLERVTWMFMSHASAKTTIDSMPPLSWISQLLQSIFAGEIAPDALTVVVIALCAGAAWSVPSAFALPGMRSARLAWVVALTLTILVVSMIGASLAQKLEAQFLGPYPKSDYPVGDRFWLMGAYALPALIGWLIVSLVSGSLVYWNLRPSSAAGISQVYARFD